MTKKPPKLTLVGPDTVGNPPPRPLGAAGQRLWAGITAACTFDDAAGRELLCSACEALDRAERCREQIDADGEMIRQGGTLKENPLLRAELSNRSFVARTLTRLGLDREPIRAVGRPPMKSFPLA